MVRSKEKASKSHGRRSPRLPESVAGNRAARSTGTRLARNPAPNVDKTLADLLVALKTTRVLTTNYDNIIEDIVGAAASKRLLKKQIAELSRGIERHIKEAIAK